MELQSLTQNQSVSDGELKKLCKRLYEQMVGSHRDQLYASTKQILAFFGSGAVMAVSYLTPHAGSIYAKKFIDSVNPNEIKEWKKYNTGYLKQTFKRLEQQGFIERAVIDGKEMLQISAEGNKRVLQYALDHLKPVYANWDGKWRMVLYDIDSTKKGVQQAMRKALKNLGYIQMQKSVYISPYSNFDEIQFLQSSLGLGENMKFIVVEKIEGDAGYRRHFGI